MKEINGEEAGRKVYEGDRCEIRFIGCRRRADTGGIKGGIKERKWEERESEREKVVKRRQEVLEGDRQNSGERNVNTGLRKQRMGASKGRECE